LPEKAGAYKNLSGKDYLRIYGWFPIAIKEKEKFEIPTIK